MKILMIAPEPFFQPRGTPFSEYYRIRCLCGLGHEVDLVTYPIGDDVDISGLRIIRAPVVLGIRSIKIGPSLAKLPLDLSLFYASWRQLAGKRYDLIHSHEEAGIMGVFLSRIYGIPHLYDMHSSLPQQLSNFNFTKSRVVRSVFEWMEETVVNAADGVIAICPSIVDQVRSINKSTHVSLIENTAESHEVDKVSPEKVGTLRAKLKLGNRKTILYIGTFEVYQGLNMLLQSMAILAEHRDDAVLLMVGGSSKQVEAARAEAERLDINKHCRFTGQVNHTEVPSFLRLADIVVSPRKTGTNTPLKIYSYLRSGAPIVATDLSTHTQVLNKDVAVLIPPNSESFARAFDKLLNNPEMSNRLSRSALELSDQHYSDKQYLDKTKTLFDYLENLTDESR